MNHKALRTTFITQVACGRVHTLLLTSSGFVYTFGKNQCGQLGLGAAQLSQPENNLMEEEEKGVE